MQQELSTAEQNAIMQNFISEYLAQNQQPDQIEFELDTMLASVKNLISAKRTLAIKAAKDGKCIKALSIRDKILAHLIAYKQSECKITLMNSFTLMMLELMKIQLTNKLKIEYSSCQCMLYCMYSYYKAEEYKNVKVRAEIKEVMTMNYNKQ